MPASIGKMLDSMKTNNEIGEKHSKRTSAGKIVLGEQKLFSQCEWPCPLNPCQPASKENNPVKQNASQNMVEQNPRYESNEEPKKFKYLVTETHTLRLMKYDQ